MKSNDGKGTRQGRPRPSGHGVRDRKKCVFSGEDEVVELE